MLSYNYDGRWSNKTYSEDSVSMRERYSQIVPSMCSHVIEVWPSILGSLSKTATSIWGLHHYVLVTFKNTNTLKIKSQLQILQNIYSDHNTLPISLKLFYFIHLPHLCTLLRKCTCHSSVIIRDNYSIASLCFSENSFWFELGFTLCHLSSSKSILSTSINIL